MMKGLNSSREALARLLNASALVKNSMEPPPRQSRPVSKKLIRALQKPRAKSTAKSDAEAVREADRTA
jgi:hypothetical protein